MPTKSELLSERKARGTFFVPVSIMRTNPLRADDEGLPSVGGSPKKGKEASSERRKENLAFDGCLNMH
jgi:hypothetical protein